MNSSQLPVYGPRKRRLTLNEIKRCFGFSDEFILPSPNTAAISALGNTIHTGLLKQIFERLLGFPSNQIESKILSRSLQLGLMEDEMKLLEPA